jgi:general secretion pathway protein G
MTKSLPGVVTETPPAPSPSFRPKPESSAASPAPSGACSPIKAFARGFTLIELLVVMAVIATLLTIAVPRYFRHIDLAREASLRQSLSVMRDALDKFNGDNGRYPESLEELVNKRYLRNVPLDPITESSETWVLVPPPDAPGQNRVWDIRSGAEGQSQDGSDFAKW